MKTTVEISDALLARARRHARKVGRPLRALIEDGLRLVLDAEPARKKYHLPDLSVGDPRGHNPLEGAVVAGPARSDLRRSVTMLAVDSNVLA